MNTLLDYREESSANTKEKDSIVLQEDSFKSLEYRKGEDIIRLPSSFKEPILLERNVRTESLYIVDETLDKVYQLVGNRNISFNSARSMGQTKILIRFYNKDFEELARTKYSGARPNNSRANNRWDKSSHDHKMGTIGWSRDWIETTIPVKTKMLIDSLVPDTQVHAPLLPGRCFRDLLDKASNALDDVFLKQGLRPSSQNKANLVGLTMNISRKILELPEIQTLLGSDARTHNIHNPNLVKLASMGYSDKTVKLLYIHGYYPKSFEELKELDEMPFDMLESVLKEAKL